MYAIIQTARLNGLDPEAYLRDVIGRIADRGIGRRPPAIACVQPSLDYRELVVTGRLR